jgi:diacylglycerol kinase
MPRRPAQLFSDGAFLHAMSVRRRMPAPKRSSLRASVGFAARGVAYAFRTQRNFRIQAGIGVSVVALAGLLRLPLHETALLVALGALVLCAELMNTALELFLDRITGSAFDPTIKRIKDLAAGSVLVVCLGAAGVGAAVFLPHLRPILLSIW